MTSIYEQVLGSDFKRLHPEMQRRYGLSSARGVASLGAGLMDEASNGSRLLLPLLQLGASRHIMFPGSGRDIPFTVENYAYRDGFGRETVSWVRTFTIGNRKHRFDTAMIFSPQRQSLVDYFGNHQNIAADIDIEVAANGGLRLRPGAQRFYEGWLALPIPGIMGASGDVWEWYDDAERCFRIRLHVTNPLLGELFSYSGRFSAFYYKPDAVPTHVRPVREEQRE